MVSRVLAGPDGMRRPCSHSWSVRTDTPSKRAELRLRQADLFSGRRHRWEVLNTTDLASLELANAFQNLYANAAMFVLRHLRFPRGSASERAPECCRPRSWDTGSASRSLPALAAGSRSREFPPRFPRPGSAHLSFLTPPEPGITAPACGWLARWLWSSP